MNVTLIHIHPRPQTQLPFDAEVSHYLKLTSRWWAAQSRAFASEGAVLEYLDAGKHRATVILCDQRGKSLNSEAFATWIGQRRDGGVAQLVLAIGPADGWSPHALKRADLRLSFGTMTLPHALARLVLAEQVYRAATILSGHPYHLGH